MLSTSLFIVPANLVGLAAVMRHLIEATALDGTSLHDGNEYVIRSGKDGDEVLGFGNSRRFRIFALFSFFRHFLRPPYLLPQMPIAHGLETSFFPEFDESVEEYLVGPLGKDDLPYAQSALSYAV